MHRDQDWYRNMPCSLIMPVFRASGQIPDSIEHNKMLESFEAMA